MACPPGAPQPTWLASGALVAGAPLGRPRSPGCCGRLFENRIPDVGEFISPSSCQCEHASACGSRCFISSSMLTSSKFIRLFISLTCTEMADLNMEVSLETDVLCVLSWQWLSWSPCSALWWLHSSSYLSRWCKPEGSSNRVHFTLLHTCLHPLPCPWGELKSVWGCCTSGWGGISHFIVISIYISPDLPDISIWNNKESIIIYGMGGRHHKSFWKTFPQTFDFLCKLGTQVMIIVMNSSFKQQTLIRYPWKHVLYYTDWNELLYPYTSCYT